MDRHAANALAVAEWLEEQPEVLSVDYAGLASNPYHPVATRYLTRGFGSVFSFTLAGGVDVARTFIDAVEVFTRMTHLGDVRSLILHPGTTSHVLRTEEEQRRSGIWPGLIRLSVGIEDVADLIDDLDGAFRALRASSTDDSAAESEPVLEPVPVLAAGATILATDATAAVAR